MARFKLSKILAFILVSSSFTLSGCNNANSNTYSLGGSISSTATINGLVLSDGLGNTVPLASGNTTFSFNSGTPYLYTNTRYHVTVQSQPNGLRCNITNGTGTPNAANVSNVAVSCTQPNSPTTLSSFSTGTTITGIIADSNNNLYIADGGNLFEIPSGGAKTPLILKDSSGTPISSPMPITSIALNSTGTAIYASSGSSGQVPTLVEKITLPTATVTVLAGLSTPGTANGNGTAAAFSNIQGIAVDSNENVYVRDAGSSLSIRKIDTAGNVGTLAGSGQTAHVDGTGTSASFDFSDTTSATSNSTVAITLQNNSVSTPIAITNGISIDSSGNLYVVEGGNNNDIRKISSSGTVSTLVGYTGTFVTTSTTNGSSSTATFANPYAITIDASDNIYVIDGNNDFRMVTRAGSVSTLLSSGATTTFTGTLTTPKTITNTGGSFGPFQAIAVDSTGNLYASTYYNTPSPSSISQISFH